MSVMRARVVLLSCVASIGAWAAEPAKAPVTSTAPHLVVLDFKGVAVDESSTKLVQKLVVQALSNHKGIDPIAIDDVKAMIALEGQKQSIGCTENSCLAEVAQAMGAELVVAGEVGMLGDHALLQLSLYDAKTGSVVARQTVDAARVDALGDKIPHAVTSLLHPLVESGRIRDVVSDGNNPWGTVAVVGLSAGAVTAAVGLGVLAYANSVYANPLEKLSDRDTWRAVALPALIVGAAGATVFVAGFITLIVAGD